MQGTVEDEIVEAAPSRYRALMGVAARSLVIGSAYRTINWSLEPGHAIDHLTVVDRDAFVGTRATRNVPELDLVLETAEAAGLARPR